MFVHRRWIGYVALLLYLVIAGCGSQGGSQDGPATTPFKTSDIVGASDTITLHPSVIGLGDLPHLIWSSFVIVRGQVTEELPADRYPAENRPLGTETPDYVYDQRIYTDYRVDVLATYRGRSVDTVTIRQLGGTVGELTVRNDAAVDMKSGDEAVFFLIPSTNPASKDVLWLLGGAQGYWKRADDRMIPAADSFAPQSLSELELTIAVQLQGQPPADMPEGTTPGDFYSLTDAPLGPNLPQVPGSEAPGTVTAPTTASPTVGP